MIALLFIGCLTANRFDERYAEEFCKYAQECEVLDLEGFSTLSECESEAGILPEECEEFDRKTAQTCLEDLATMTCPQAMSGTPRSCNKVCS